MNVVRSRSLVAQHSSPEHGTARVVVIGGGPSGVRASQELSRRGMDVILFNAEKWTPYNRVKLTPLLAGEIQIGQVYQTPAYPGPGTVTRYDGTRIAAVDCQAKTVTADTGRTWTYGKLVLAFGSSAFVPNLVGGGLSGVFSFRSASDVEALLARSFSARAVAVIGGGLLGLEAARGMAKRGAVVTVIEHEHRLMPRQLDEMAGQLLSEQVEALGVRVRTGVRVASLTGAGRVETLTLSTGESLACDTVILCTGVRANLTVARAAGLTLGRGVIVDDRMRTSDPDVYAIGECAEHNGVIYGLVGPGLEQAEVAARQICGEAVRYRGSMPTTKLKVIGADVFSMGEVEILDGQPGVKTYRYQSADGAIYRKIYVDRGQLVGALGVGVWREASWLQQALLNRKRVLPWTIRKFQRTGVLWDFGTSDDIFALPNDAILCNCTGVTRGRVGDAIKVGASCLDDIKRDTGASTVCGSCTPMIQELLGVEGGTAEPVKYWKPILALSSAAAILGIASLSMPRVPLADHFEIGGLREQLWFDGGWKQLSGYMLLGLTALAAALSLRKRVRWFDKIASYDGWRLVHLGIGAVALLALFAHTGFRLGENLNYALMLSFLATLIFGAAAGLATGGEHTLRANGIGAAKAPPRALPAWAHIFAVWPLPVLLMAHIVSVYAF